MYISYSSTTNPKELPSNDDETIEIQRHAMQMNLLNKTFKYWLKNRDNGYSGGNMFNRNRLTYFIMILIVTGLGLASRRYPELLPDFISRYAGDTLWALLVFLVIGWWLPSLSTWKVATTALLFSLLIEISQLYHAPWIDEIRHYRLAALILGHSFLWSDLVCYSLGVTLGVIIEKLGKVHRAHQ